MKSYKEQLEEIQKAISDRLYYVWGFETGG